MSLRVYLPCHDFLSTKYGNPSRTIQAPKLASEDQAAEGGIEKGAEVWMPGIATHGPAICSVRLPGCAGTDDHGAMMSPSESNTL